MSITEITLIIIVALVVIKPEDIPSIMKKLKELYKYIISIKKQIDKEINDITDEDKGSEDLEKINFYLKKIMDLGETYTGDYSLSDVKVQYHQFLLSARNKVDKK